jgi:hypothetical protein
MVVLPLFVHHPQMNVKAETEVLSLKGRAQAVNLINDGMRKNRKIFYY